MQGLSQRSLKVAAQLQKHLNHGNLYESLQSGFHTVCSTETTLLRVTNNLCMMADDAFYPSEPECSI